MLLIDRVVTALGARRLVQGRPGSGWLLIEVVPAGVWSQLTGGMSMEGYYLVAYLTALGATGRQLAWLPFVFFVGIIGAAFVVLMRAPSANAVKRTCVRDTLIGRACFLGTVAWPLFAWWLNLPTAAVLAGVFVAIGACQLIHFAGAAAFVTWMQAVVPPHQRGDFLRWRNLASFIAVATVVQALAWLWPVNVSGHADTQRTALMWLIGLATMTGVMGTWLLAQAPAPALALRPGPPVKTLVREMLQARAMMRLMGWNWLVTAALALTLPYLPKVLDAAGVTTATYAAWTSRMLYPAMLLGIVIAGNGLQRWGGARVLIATQLTVTIGEASFLLLNPSNHAWLLPACLALAGLGRGMLGVAWFGRLQEVIPPGDPRVPALFHAAGGVAGLIMAIALLGLVPALEHARVTWPWIPESAWVLIALASALRLAALMAVLKPLRPVSTERSWTTV